jgi:hypothetical protein
VRFFVALLCEVSQSVAAMSELNIDVKRLVKALGGRAQLFRKLKAKECSLSHRTIDNWVDRNSIPLKRFILLADIAKAEGWDLKITDYINEKKQPQKPNARSK